MVVCEPGGRLPWKPWAHVLISLSSGYLPLQQKLSLQTGSERPLEAHVVGRPRAVTTASPLLSPRPCFPGQSCCPGQNLCLGGTLPAAPTEASGVPSLPFSSLSPKDRAQGRGLLPEPRVDTWHRNSGGAFSLTSTHGLTGSEASLFIPLWLHWVFAVVQAFSSCSDRRAAPRCIAWASHCARLSCRRPRAIGLQTSVVAARGLRS